MMDYTWQTTFWMDFSIADRFGEKAVKDTFKRAFKEWKDEVVYITELVLVLNWKCWDHFNSGDFNLSGLYAKLYHEANDYAREHLKGEELEYFFRTTD